MRIIPASLYFHDANTEVLIEKMREISGITHRHFRSVFACFIFSKLTSLLFHGLEKMAAFNQAIEDVNNFIEKHDFNSNEVKLFERILFGSIVKESEKKIYSSGYILHTLEASIWCFLTTHTYQEAVLQAVNLGEDTDTTGCVTGALAGLYYGIDDIPEGWKSAIARKDDILALGKNFQMCLDKLNLAKS